MRFTVLNKKVVSFALFLFLMSAAAHAAAASPAPLQAKQEAEAKGYIFFTTHDEIMALAKKEGKLRVSSGWETTTFKPLINAFKQKYPFFTDIHLEEIRDPDAFQRFILEMKSGQATGWDIGYIPIDFAKEYPPYLMKHDILGMAKHGVLKIDPRMIHPGEKNIVSVTSNIALVPYNRKLIPDDKVPSKWEDFLKPEFKGRKFIVNLRPVEVAGLVPAWGLERTLEFARKLAAQQPVWGIGGTRANNAVARGESSLYCCSNLSSVRRVMSKDLTRNFSYKIIEPVPTIAVYHASAILNRADHPHAALLWLEFLGSPEGQEIIDKYEPLRASVFTPGSAVAQEVRGKELSLIDWNHVTNFQEYAEKIFAAYGFPKADK